MKETKSRLHLDLIWVYDNDKRIIFYREPETTTKNQLDHNFQEIKKMTRSFEDFFMILDLTVAKRPNAEIRQYILEKFELVKNKLSHVAVVTGKNFIINMAVTFILRKSKLKSYSIQKTLAEAEKSIDDKIN
ncbi:MAG: hypothetical protein RIM99_07220 [Cyclobacteriaceae bacterium]